MQCLLKKVCWNRVKYLTRIIEAESSSMAKNHETKTKLCNACTIYSKILSNPKIETANMTDFLIWKSLKAWHLLNFLHSTTRIFFIWDNNSLKFLGIWFFFWKSFKIASRKLCCYDKNHTNYKTRWTAEIGMFSRPIQESESRLSSLV